MYDEMTACTMLNAFVPISRFNKGEAGKIIEEVKRDGIKVIVKNNAPECVMITVEDYDRLVEKKNRPLHFTKTPEQEMRWQECLARARERAKTSPPIPPAKNRKEVMDTIGSIQVDEDAVNELRRISTL